MSDLESAISDTSHALEFWFGPNLNGWPDNPAKFFGTPAREAIERGRKSRDAEVESLQAELADTRLVIARVQEYLMTCRVLRTEPDKNKIAAFLDAAPSSALDTVK